MDHTLNKEKYSGQTVLAIDYGTKNIGLCLHGIGRDPFPLPYEQINNSGDEEVVKHIEGIHKNEYFDFIVLGLPKHKDGSNSEMTNIILRFHEKLKIKFQDLNIFFQDEALSSYEAEDRMKNSPKYNFKIDKTKLDALAASIILEEWLNSIYAAGPN